MVRVVRELSDQVKMVRENFVASLVNYAIGIQKALPKEYKAQVEAAQAAGQPILEADAEAIKVALIAQAEANIKAKAPTAEPELVPA